MKLFARIVAGCWLILAAITLWAEYGFPSDDRIAMAWLLIVWLPVVALLTLAFIVSWIAIKFYRLWSSRQ